MPEVFVPQDRTIKQPTSAICQNPECAVDGKQFVFQVAHEKVACPKCGADQSPMILLPVMTHLLVRDKTGPVRGSGGIKYAMACSTRRAYLATATNRENATDNPAIVNCEGCLATIKERKIIRPTGTELKTANTGE